MPKLVSWLRASFSNDSVSPVCCHHLGAVLRRHGCCDFFRLLGDSVLHDHLLGPGSGLPGRSCFYSLLRFCSCSYCYCAGGSENFRLDSGWSPSPAGGGSGSFLMKSTFSNEGLGVSPREGQSVRPRCGSVVACPGQIRTGGPVRTPCPAESGSGDR